MDVLPAIDLRHGQVVRLRQGRDAERTSYGDPEPWIERFAAAGARRLHVVDLDAAFGEAPQRESLRRVVAAATSAGLMVQLGGGLRSIAAIEEALELGFARAVVGSFWPEHPAAFAELAGHHPGRLVAAFDVEDGALRVGGWRERSTDALAELAGRLRGVPLAAVLVTDIARDGMMTGANIELAKRVAEWSGVDAIVSGGVASEADLDAARSRAGLSGVVVGRALLDGTIALHRGLFDRGTRLARRVIPCLDVAAGRVVKGLRFADLRDQGDPVAAAERYAAEGADEIVFLDITAAPERRGTDLAWVERTASRVFVPLTVGGGIRSPEDARHALLAGADKVAINTAAFERPQLIDELAQRFGSQCVVLSVDVKRRLGDDATGWTVVTGGGRRDTGHDALAWIAAGVAAGAGEVLLTSIDADGTGGGYDLELLRAAARVCEVPMIASGGAGSVEDLAAALEAGAAAVLAASIFHSSQTTVDEVKRELRARGFAVRAPRAQTVIAEMASR